MSLAGDLQHHHFDERLLAGPQGGAAPDSEANRLANLILITGAVGARRSIRSIRDKIVAVLFDRDSERPDERRPREFAGVVHGDRDRDQPTVTDAPPLVHRGAVRWQDHVAVENEPTNPHLVDLSRLARREADHVTILLHHRMLNPMA